MRISTYLSFCLLAHFIVKGQEPDLSKMNDGKDKIAAWMSYVESLRLNRNGARDNYVLLEQAALKGVRMAKPDDAKNRSKFYFLAGFGCYYQVKFDSAQYYFYKALEEAKAGKYPELMSSACVALIPVNFQLGQQAKVDSCKDILQSILDTTKNKKILQDGYSAMGSYYQQKSFYSTAQDFLLKTVELRKREVDTTSDAKLKADYAIQCYLLSKQYQNTDVLDKSLAILREGQPYAGASPLVSVRYLSSFTEIYSLLGNIDSALYYESALEQATRNSPTVPSEMVTACMNIAKFYLEHNQVSKAFPFVTKADTLAAKSKSPILIFQAQLIKGRYVSGIGDYSQAISLFSQALPVAKKISKEQYVECLKYMGDAQKASGNLKEALDFYSLYTKSSDSLTKEKISRNFADQETRYETNQKQQRIETLAKENKLNTLELQNASRTKAILVIGLATLGIISLLLYFIYRNKEKSNILLNERNRQLDFLNSQLALANETKAKLFGIISHDLRSPVSQIVQLLQIQKERPELLDGESTKRHEERLRTASENMLETMEDILLWSKSQMQHFAPELSKINISLLAKKELNFLQGSIGEKNIEIRNSVDENFVQRTDEHFSSVIVRNLLQNAVKYSGDGSTITISNDKNSLYITNTSPQSNADELNNILSSKQVDSKSSGLGLQLTNDLASSIGVKILFSQQSSNELTAAIHWAG